MTTCRANLSLDTTNCIPWRTNFVPRIRHCVECPKCSLRYLISFSRYDNGSYLVPTITGSSEEYVLYCVCRTGMVASRWKWSEVKTCEVWQAAYKRGYGTPDEIVLLEHPPGDAWTFNVSQYLAKWRGLD